VSRSIDFGRIFGELVRLYRANAGPLISLAAVVFLPVAFLTALLEGSDPIAGLAVQTLLSGPVTFLYAGLAAPVVVRARQGGVPAEPGDMLDAMQPVAATLLLAGLIWVMVLVLGLAALLVPGLIWATITILTPSAITLERRPVMESFRRSRALVRGNGPAVFGVLLGVGLTLVLAGLLLQATGGAIGGTAGAFIGSWLAAVLTAPPTGLLPTVLFLDLGGSAEPVAEEREEERPPREEHPAEEELQDDDAAAEPDRAG